MGRPMRQGIDEGNFDGTDEIKRGDWKVGHPKVVLNKPGAYNFFGPNVCHSWKAIEDTKLVGVRWPSIPDDGIECDHNY